MEACAEAAKAGGLVAEFATVDAFQGGGTRSHRTVLWSKLDSKVLIVIEI